MSCDDDKTVLYEGADLEVLANVHRYQCWIVESFQPYLSGRAVEFGAGIGNISTLIRPYVTSLDLVEPSANLAAPLQQRFAGDDGIAIYGEPLEIRLPAIGDETYDSVLLVNVLEHIEDDIGALDGFYRILKPGGHLLLFVPALKFLYSDLDKLVGHFRRYQKPELDERVAGAGFGIIQSRYFDILGVAPWWLFNTMLGATGFSPLLTGINDAAVVPLSRGMEGLVAPPFGKNVLLVARRPEALSGGDRP
ncbi:MAG TPA: class I SAM-dependent methyltransferase [Rhodospirillales bacterium]|nr:class I SAM-dependent methyltransferase [Rhodospirillales bacterium]